MGVYIRGMEVPKSGAYLIRLYVRDDGGADIWGVGTYIPKEPLPVVPAPPHGRLIDADALENGFKKLVYQDNWYYNELHHAPTIILAEEGET